MSYEVETYAKNQMVKIPRGEIVLRDDRIKHKWKVEIKPFLLAKYPVTQDLYYDITQKAPSSSKGNQNPVENVSWYDAIQFCNLLSQREGLRESYSISSNGEDVTCDWESEGYRLPTEAEWEYGCRAGTTEVIYGEIDKIAWYKENSIGKTHEAGKKEPNAWGLYDMLGNVWEWCWDVYDEKVYGSYRIFRGGGWSDPARGCLASNRRRSHPTFYIDDLGLRLAKSLKEFDVYY
ncbi:Formylglycine-generating enzyme, required for sulfatase activity, contains SUMF1/FGE domain [Natronincola peptidivorans]|uniref:Formylglycine-generating enzyme, required for sulfatase activity, contains SUMF1/FGE domain n=1 Tax=Natronincola peptidivorans TaxID=426128 RepID=A0A1I0B3F5_9FIRM|nr:formylglycine-generating enzyme family protein [Natronincola peptidivorans]SET01021.1 Formylglycine-generating enzyme, required for sulfatase activity, contains SUMF1/FGE domain [Natronincola peptidivorans]